MSVIKSSIVQSYAAKLGSDFTQLYSNSPLPQLELFQPYGDAGLLNNSLINRWRDSITISSHVDTQWGVTQETLTDVSQTWALISDTVKNEIVHGWTTFDVSKLSNSFVQGWWSDLSGSVVDGATILPVVSTPTKLLSSVVSLNLEYGSDQYVISASIELADVSEWMTLKEGDQVTISNILGTTFNLIVEELTANKTPTSRGYFVTLVSPTVLLDLPYANNITDEHTGMVSDIVSSLCPGVVWNAVDWYIGPNILFSDDDPPLEIIRRLTSSIKAVIGTSPDGTLTISPRYKVTVPNIGIASIDLEIVEATQVVSTSFDVTINPGYNSIEVSNGTGTNNSDSIKVQVTDITPFRKKVSVQTSPQVDTELTHSGCPVISVMAPTVEEVLVENETVEIVNGEGTTKNTVHTVISYVWSCTDLGSVTIDQSGTVKSSIVGDSLLIVTYKYLEKNWEVVSTFDGQVQFIASSI